MMQIVYYSRKEQFLQEMEARDNVVFVAPSPVKADGLRIRLGSVNQDVVTIAKFTADLIQVLWKAGGRPEVKRKADLLLIFGLLKNKYFPELGYEQFTQAYNLFSDLRSFTLDLEALSPVLDEQPQEIKKAVALFWQLLEVTGYHDEHGAYQKITEELRSAEEHVELRKTYIFWGFSHLNGQQVDLLKALSIRYDVIVPFPLALREKLKKSDWISWAIDANVEEVEHGVMLRQPRANWVRVNSREHTKVLKEMVRDGDQIVLGVSKLGPLHIDFVPSKKVSYKIPHQLIEAEIQELKESLRPGTDLRAQLKAKILPGNYKLLKAIQLYEEALDLLSGLTDDAPVVDNFFLKLLGDVVSLNQPRTSWFPMAQEELTISLKDTSSLEEIDRTRRVILCIDERFDEIQGLGQNYPEVIQKTLGSIGPMKRNELELLFKQWEFNDLFSEADVTLLMSEGTLKHSLVWKRILSEVAFNTIDPDRSATDKKVIDHFQAIEKKVYQGSFSASKFQTFTDCPRKFYFSYVDKVFPSIELEKDFDALTSGTIIHKIIEIFHKEKLDLPGLPALTARIMEEHILQGELNLPRDTYEQRKLIFNHRALNGIRFLEELKGSLDPQIQWQMEVDFNLVKDFPLKGKIDCLGVSDKFILLLDFKSTKGSASSNKEVEKFESIQLWTYARAARDLVPGLDGKSVIMGFIVLDNPSESNLFAADDDTHHLLKSAKLCRAKQFEAGFTEMLKAAEERMLSLVQSISSETSFPARPRTPKSCHFCELTKVCVKSEVTNV